MTDYQKTQIEQLRGRGAGYKLIAAMTGLSRDIVRNYCKSHRLTCDAESESNLRERIKQGLVCKNCGGPLTRAHTGRPRSFCSDACRSAWWTNHKNVLNRNPEATYAFTCLNCGKPFTAYGNSKRKYCCHECYIEHRFRAG